jgi:hypothetical protein
LIDQIRSHLTRNDLKHTFTLNKAFSSAAEYYSGGFQDFELTEDNSQKFLGIYSGRRSRLLRHVVLRMHLAPILPNKLLGSTCREDRDELDKKDVSFTNQVKFLFETVQRIERFAGSCRIGRIKMTIYGPTRRVDGEFVENMSS